MARCVEELQVFQRAVELAHAISAIVTRPAFQHDLRLRQQLASSSAAVASLIAEGFPLSTDRHFAQYLYRARAESSETRAHLLIAIGRGYLTDDELADLCARYVEVERMLRGLIRHLERENRKHRG